jgi:hypothetical protein
VSQGVRDELQSDRRSADNLFFGVAEYVLRPDVPRHHSSVRINHEDGIVADVFDCLAIDVFCAAVSPAAFIHSSHSQETLDREKMKAVIVA